MTALLSVTVGAEEIMDDNLANIPTHPVCGHCNEEIKPLAKVCPHCHRSQSRLWHKVNQFAPVIPFLTLIFLTYQVIILTRQVGISEKQVSLSEKQYEEATQKNIEAMKVLAEARLTNRFASLSANASYDVDSYAELKTVAYQSDHPYQEDARLRAESILNDVRVKVTSIYFDVSKKDYSALYSAFPDEDPWKWTLDQFKTNYRKLSAYEETRVICLDYIQKIMAQEFPKYLNPKPPPFSEGDYLGFLLEVLRNEKSLMPVYKACGMADVYVSANGNNFLDRDAYIGHLEKRLKK